MPRWKVCSDAGCGILHSNRGGRCHKHERAHDKQRGTASQRGYDSDHRSRRARLLPDAIGTLCPLCGDLMLPGQPLDLDHTIPLAVDPTSRGDRICHASCNRGRRD